MADEKRDTMELWNKVCKTNPKYTKQVKMRGGFTSINPHYQCRKATELWGPYGKDWGIREIEHYFSPDGASVILKGKFYFPGGWFTMLVDAKWEAGRDVAKCLMTELQSKSLSKLGFSADIFSGEWDDNLYARGEDEAPTKTPTRQAPPPPTPTPAPGEPSKPDFTGILAAATGTYGATNRPSLPPRGECKGSTSEPQVKRMFAIAKKQGWTKEQMEYAVKGLCGVEHSTELGYEQYQWLCGNHEQPGRDFYPPMVDGLFETPPPDGFGGAAPAPVPVTDDDVPF